MIVVVAGRRIDPPNAAATRFPLSMRVDVAGRIRAALTELGATMVVSSAACGTDLLALDAARALKIRQRIVLPYQESWFEEDSVTDRPGRWGPLYRRLIALAHESNGMVILHEARGSDNAYRAANDAIMGEARRLAGEENPADPASALAGLIVWEGQSRGPDDVTDHMRQRLEAGGARVRVVLTTPESAGD